MVAAVVVADLGAGGEAPGAGAQLDVLALGAAEAQRAHLGQAVHAVLLAELAIFRRQARRPALQRNRGAATTSAALPQAPAADIFFFFFWVIILGVL